MKTAFKLIAAYAAAFIALWLLGGFVAMDFDVRNWDSGGRYLVASLSFGGCIAVFATEGIA